MGKLKAIITALIYFGSCAALVSTHAVVSVLQTSHTKEFLEALGGQTRAFTSIALSIIPNTALICFGTLVISALLATVAIRRSNSQESKLYWLTVLGSFNYYVSAFVFGAVLIGFFVLPKLANGT